MNTTQDVRLSRASLACVPVVVARLSVVWWDAYTRTDNCQSRCQTCEHCQTQDVNFLETDKTFYYMASSVSRQDEQITRCDWLLERAQCIWSFLAPSELPAFSNKRNFPESQIILYWPSFFGEDGWILASFLFYEFLDLDSVSVHKHAKNSLANVKPSSPKKFGQYCNLYILCIIKVVKQTDIV